MKQATVFYSEKDFDAVLNKMPEVKGPTGVKIHVGEMGNITYLNPVYAEKIIGKLKKCGVTSSLIECNVLYRGSRTNRKDHLKTAKAHGYDFADLDIVDGEYGEESWEIEVKRKHFDRILVGSGLKKYDNIITLSHFKGHGANGFGGALKNLGMGLGSRAGKMAMHAAFDLKINAKKCIGCGICAQKCDFGAIAVNKSGKAEIDFSKCSRCAGCIANCPQGAVEMPWNGTSSEGLQERIVEYCYGITNQINCPFYINVLKNITARCDCAGVKMQPISKDLGYLASSDPVALDRASLDLVMNSNGGKDIIKEGNGVDSTRQLLYAEEVGLGTNSYKIEKI